MGSFANSVHIKSGRAADVIEAIRTLLLAEGYERTEEEVPEEVLWGMPSPLRAIQVSEAREGWVTVLDSDLMNSLELAGSLSAALRTHALQILVNDSDSWHYQLYHNGEHVDEFDSSGGEGFTDEDGDGMAGLFGALGMRADGDEFQNIMARARQMAEQVQQAMPPEIRAIQERMEQQRATPEEIHQYTQWMNAEVPRLMGNLKDVMGDFSSRLAPPLDRPAASEGENEESPAHLQRHLVHLQPLLKGSAGEEQVLKVMARRAVFAEEMLGDFLPLIGINPYYANLSYRYLTECTPKDLERESIRLAEHLKFKQGDGPSQGRLRIVG